MRGPWPPWGCWRAGRVPPYARPPCLCASPAWRTRHRLAVRLRHVLMTRNHSTRQVSESRSNSGLSRAGTFGTGPGEHRLGNGGPERASMVERMGDLTRHASRSWAFGRRGAAGSAAHHHPSPPPFTSQPTPKRGCSGSKSCRQTARDCRTYLLDDGLRERLAHGDEVSICNSAAARLPACSGVEGGERRWLTGGNLGSEGRQR